MDEEASLSPSLNKSTVATVRSRARNLPRTDWEGLAGQIDDVILCSIRADQPKPSLRRILETGGEYDRCLRCAMVDRAYDLLEERQPLSGSRRPPPIRTQS